MLQELTCWAVAMALAWYNIASAPLTSASTPACPQTAVRVSIRVQAAPFDVEQGGD